MSNYRYINLKSEKDSSTIIEFYFYYYKRTTIEDLLEYIIYNYTENNFCLCFQLKYKKEKLDLKTNFNDKFKNSGTIDIYVSNTKCNCHQTLKDNIKKSRKEIIDLLIEKEDKINEFKKLSNDQKDKISQLESELNNEKQKLRITEEKMNKNITEHVKEIENLKNDIKNKTNEIIKKNEDENKYKEYEDKINKLEKDKQLLEMGINGDITLINQLKNLGVTGEYLKPKSDLIKVDPQTNKIISKGILNKDIIFTNFYDMIIDINSIKGIKKGWDIKMSERIKKNYSSLKSEKIIKIGVIGNSNKGKSFILSKLSKINLPSGTSIRTEGLSVKYPELDLYINRKIALLDSAGLETPVLKEVDNEKLIQEDNEGNNELITKEKKENEEKNENEEKKENKEKKENEENKDDLKEDELENENKSEKEIFREKSREKLITELFLQNYIIYNTNILIIVVGILSYSEQKLINRIRTEIQRAKINRKLFIIHNLLTYTTKEQIKEYIDTYLLKSATFNLEEGHKISSSTKEENGTYFFEKHTEPKIYHLIFANEGSEAGEYYNNFTLNFIENQYADVIDLKPFDVIETVKDKFIEISKEILEKVETPFQKTDFDDTTKTQIKLKNLKNIKLKKCLIDELGFSNLTTNSFEPNYNCYKKDDKIIVRVEVPGNCQIKTGIEYEGEYTVLKISGTKKKDKEPEKDEDNLYNSRVIGDFSFNVLLKPDEYLIKNEKPKIEEKKGLIIIQFQLDEKNSEATFGDNLNDDV